MGLISSVRLDTLLHHMVALVVYLHHVGGLSLQVETPTFSCLGDRWAFTSLCGDLRLGSVANSHPVLFEMLRVSVTSVAGQKI